MARLTVKDIIISELRDSNEPLSHRQIADRSGANINSVRRATRELQIAGQVRTARFGNGTTLDPDTWTVTGPAPMSQASATTDATDSAVAASL